MADAAAAAEARGNQLSEAAGDGSEVSVAWSVPPGLSHFGGSLGPVGELHSQIISDHSFP